MATRLGPTSAGPTRASALVSYRTRQTVEVWILRIILIALVLVSLFPTIYVVLYSLKGGSPSLYSSTLIPQRLTLDNYAKLLRGQFPIWVRNSLVLGAGVALIQVSLATFAAYAFSRLRFPGRKFGILGLLILQTLPVFAAIVAIFRVFSVLGLLNTLTGVIILLGLGGSAGGVWLLKNFMDSVPRDLDEAAYMDGATVWQTFRRVLLPLVVPMLVVQVITTFIGVYNEYIMVSILLSDPQKYPLGIGVRSFSAGFATNWTTFCAAATLGSFPFLILFFVSQRFLVEGLMRGAIKG